MRLVFAGIVIFLTVLFLLLPSPIEPVAWSPPVPIELPNPKSQLLESLQVVSLETPGPEDLAIDDANAVYAGVESGEIFRVLPDGKSEVFARTGGRPLGMDFAPDGSLIVADASAGLLSISSAGVITTLLPPMEGRFMNDVDVGSTGAIYFTTTSIGFPLIDYELDIIESRPKGELFVYDPTLGTVDSLLNELHFANGVALAPDESFVLVVETTRYRVKRLFLAGERKGMSDIFIDRLPAFPDGISSNGKGLFWLALVAPRLGTVDNLAEWPQIRNQIAKIPKGFRPKARRTLHALSLSQDGRIVERFFEASGDKLAMISSIEEKNGIVYFASLTDPAYGKLELPPHLGSGGGAPANSP